MNIAISCAKLPNSRPKLQSYPNFVLAFEAGNKHLPRASIMQEVFPLTSSAPQFKNALSADIFLLEVSCKVEGTFPNFESSLVNAGD